jgi:hypothetical protein
MRLRMTLLLLLAAGMTDAVADDGNFALAHSARSATAFAPLSPSGRNASEIVPGGLRLLDELRLRC